MRNAIVFCKLQGRFPAESELLCRKDQVHLFDFKFNLLISPGAHDFGMQAAKVAVSLTFSSSSSLARRVALAPPCTPPKETVTLRLDAFFIAVDHT
jgi:hypothetical protein